MDLSTTYLGFVLPHPLMPGASPLSEDLDGVRRLEDAGAAAIVLRSLFEEQVRSEPGGDEDGGYAFGPDEYLDLIHAASTHVEVPVIASLNGTSHGWWLSYARLAQQAGADALELNVYELATDPSVSSEEVERRALGVLQAVKRTVGIPVAVKLSPYYSSLASFAHRLDAAGADALVLFNRFYQADIDIEELEVVRSLELSDPSELLLRLRWLAILSGNVEASLAVTGGVHDAVGALKATMAGAQGVQMVSALIENGPGCLRRVLDDMGAWLERNGYDSLRQLQGSLSLRYCADPRAFERANYVQVLQSRVVEGF